MPNVLHDPPSVAPARRLPLPGVLVWAVFLAILIPVVILGSHTLFFTRSATPVDPARQELASTLAGEPVQPLTGPLHTVYFSAAPLPTTTAPRADGRATLVWFSSTNCEDCKRMEDFAYTTAQQFTSRMVFAEKPTNRDSAAGRYGIEQPPAFVLLDARGGEITRFGYEPTAEAFASAITSSLK